MIKIHWIGTGLSAMPGLKRLIEDGFSVMVYNRTINKVYQNLTKINDNCKIIKFSFDIIEKNIKAGDIVVSMLPGDFHVQIAKICLLRNAHFISSSYISDEMKKLNNEALEKKLCFVNEVGLDPGIDHCMSHALINEYKKSEVFSKDNQHYFLSYCGGLSEIPNDFCYKFSWSPLGVLKALMNPSTSIRNGKTYHVKNPWESVEPYHLPMPWGEDVFEVYPNRDSIPFITQYKMNDGFKINKFVRGTLRYKGWKKAWSKIFFDIASMKSKNSEKELNLLSDKLWNLYSYKTNEIDRVILTVELKVEKENKIIWHKQFILDTLGNSKGSAMAQLVSNSVALAVKAIFENEIIFGVSATPNKDNLVNRWLSQAEELSDNFILINRLY